MRNTIRISDTDCERSVLGPGDADAGPEAAAGTEVIYSLMRTQRFLSNRITKTFAPYGVGWTGFEIMQSLVRAGGDPISVLTIAHTLERHWTSISKAVTGLERAGHVNRFLNPANRRENLVELTGSGRTAFHQVTAALGATAATCIPAHPTADELLRNLDSLERELRSLDAARRPADHA
ncbi:MarR family winged helix-turn-helix transcriptional regulator [Rhodococcus koreensis]